MPLERQCHSLICHPTNEGVRSQVQTATPWSCGFPSLSVHSPHGQVSLPFSCKSLKTQLLPSVSWSCAFLPCCFCTCLFPVGCIAGICDFIFPILFGDKLRERIRHSAVILRDFTASIRGSKIPGQERVSRVAGSPL